MPTLGKSYFCVKKIGLSEATVRTRLNRLIEKEYIQIVAVSNPIKLGFDIRSYRPRACARKRESVAGRGREQPRVRGRFEDIAQSLTLNG